MEKTITKTYLTETTLNLIEARVPVAIDLDAINEDGMNGATIYINVYGMSLETQPIYEDETYLGIVADFNIDETTYMACFVKYGKYVDIPILNEARHIY